ncbi:hypothetical protein CPB83DRAFT_891374 [Crepidotus variabilis]|uniref:NUDE domain-containing protein n=1 Tax=Crepidotus variabilis TaxID=179855 RepID=A0A9P6EN51_9AGAR|nr:hypothetical protein CPB83DRAFT_891374 [Crepidotus variabilis]
MTAVLSASDIFRKDRHMSLEDNFPPDTDWREKYNEVLDMLSETRAELDEFHTASKELEAELESELQRTEKSQQELQAKVARSEHDRDEWKSKFMTLQTNHNTTTTSLQRELDKLRQEHQKTKELIRELEMGNDDLERNERAVSSSLADMERKYSTVLEEKILLEHELLEKAGLEEETQRLKDELRDANVETSILKDQITALNARPPPQPAQASRPAMPSTDNLLKTLPPPDMDMADISPSSETAPPPPDTITTPKANSRPAVPASFISHAMQREKSSPSIPLKTTTNLMRSTTLPGLSSPSAIPSPRTFVRPNTTARSASIATTSSSGSMARNKGVQMVSEMRARVKNLEQKIHTRVPRLRMASITGRQAAASPHYGSVTPVSSSSSVKSSSSTAKTSWESQRKSAESRTSNDSGSERSDPKNAGDSSGWVLIMEDSPSPQKDKEATKRAKERRRLSNPSAFRPGASTYRAPSPSMTTGSLHTGPHSLAISTGLRRPQSRLSAGGTPSASRPQTPTFLPLPSSSSRYGGLSQSTGIKRSTGPDALNHPYTNGKLKRASIGKGVSPPVPPLPKSTRARPITMPPLQYRRDSGGTSPGDDLKDLPDLPDDLLNHVTIRGNSRMPSSTSTTSASSALSKSRIGRPSAGGLSVRRSGGPDALDIKDLRPRSATSS